MEEGSRSPPLLPLGGESRLLHPGYIPESLDVLPGYEPELDFGKDVSRAWKEFQESQLSKETEVYTLRCMHNWSDAQDANLNEKQFKRVVKQTDVLTFELFSISRYLVRSRQTPAPEDARKLRISSEALHSLLSQYDIPSAFTSAVCRYYQTCGTGLRERMETKSPGAVWEYWCLLPVRVQVHCRNDANFHAKSTAGSNQMDPFHYIHLSDAHVDVRGSRIALFTRHNCGSGATFVLCVNFQDGRWADVVEEPLKRIKETIKSRGSAKAHAEPAFVHLIFLSSVIRWWNDVLLSFNQQLIAHERKLQEEMENPSLNSSGLYTELNKNLHVMAAHLHRYGSELGQLEGILVELQSRHKKSKPPIEGEAPYNNKSTDDVNAQADGDWQVGYDERNGGCESMAEWRRARNGFSQLLSRLRAVRACGKELESKIQNILALLFNNIQVMNDRNLQALLSSAKEEARISQRVAVQSYELSRKMGEDSIAMKTIAILTMFFLPGTSYAALLSMPFFSTNEYLTTTSRLWIWVLLTAPSMGIAFYIFWKVTKRQRRVTEQQQRDCRTDDDPNAADIEMQNLPNGTA